MGDAISHAVLPGVALSFILGIDFFIGAIIFGLLASVIITYIKGNSIIKSDTAIGITFSSLLALGIILISVAKSSTDLFHILFGNILAVQDIDMYITCLLYTSSRLTHDSDVVAFFNGKVNIFQGFYLVALKASFINLLNVFYI